MPRRPKGGRGFDKRKGTRQGSGRSRLVIRVRLQPQHSSQDVQETHHGAHQQTQCLDLESMDIQGDNEEDLLNDSVAGATAMQQTDSDEESIHQQHQPLAKHHIAQEEASMQPVPQDGDDADQKQPEESLPQEGDQDGYNGSMDDSIGSCNEGRNDPNEHVHQQGQWGG